MEKEISDNVNGEDLMIEVDYYRNLYHKVLALTTAPPKCQDKENCGEVCKCKPSLWYQQQDAFKELIEIERFSKMTLTEIEDFEPD